MFKRIRLGDLLVKEGILAEAELESALHSQKETGLKLGDTLIELGLISEADLLSFLAKQLKIPFINLLTFPFDKDCIMKVPEIMARRYHALPIEFNVETQHYTVAMVDPMDIEAYDGISKRLDGPIKVALVRESDILQVINDVYRKTEEIISLAGVLEAEISEEIDEEDITTASDVPIQKLLNSIFEDAVQVKASDIHLEPDKDTVRIRQRVDGVLFEQVMKGKNILPALVLRLKLMAKLNISEKRLPQDGRFSIDVKHQRIDVRMSTMPIVDGESVVMRLLPQTKERFSVPDLHMPSGIEKSFLEQLERPHGMILVTGPTGSGKSTTLYAGLNHINCSERKIITVEDPVEYSFERINQVQVQPKIGLTFASVLRSALRQDPDVVMLGEIRDEETASIALRAAITGHLVLSTIHTNDTLSTPGRLLDMGIDPFLAAGALRMILAQRLVRRNCEMCMEEYRPTPEQKRWLRHILRQPDMNAFPVFKKGAGCGTCGNTGYRGRVATYECLIVSNEMRDAIRENNTSRLNELAHATQFRSLSVAAYELAITGVTSLDELFRISAELSE